MIFRRARLFCFVCFVFFYHLTSTYKAFQDFAPFLTQHSTEVLVHALVTFCMDDSNSTLSGLCKKTHLNLLQIRQNSAARITSTKSTDHTTGHPALLAPHSPVNPIHSSVCHFQSSPQLGPLLSIKFPSSSHPFPCSRAPVVRLTGPCFRLETMVATTFIYSTFISQALCYTVASQRNTHLFTSAYQL